MQNEYLSFLTCINIIEQVQVRLSEPESCAPRTQGGSAPAVLQRAQKPGCFHRPNLNKSIRSLNHPSWWFELSKMFNGRWRVDSHGKSLFRTGIETCL